MLLNLWCLHKTPHLVNWQHLLGDPPVIIDHVRRTREGNVLRGIYLSVHPGEKGMSCPGPAWRGEREVILSWSYPWEGDMRGACGSCLGGGGYTLKVVLVRGRGTLTRWPYLLSPPPPARLAWHGKDKRPSVLPPNLNAKLCCLLGVLRCK